MNNKLMAGLLMMGLELIGIMSFLLVTGIPWTEELLITVIGISIFAIFNFTAIILMLAGLFSNED